MPKVRLGRISLALVWPLAGSMATIDHCVCTGSGVPAGVPYPRELEYRKAPLFDRFISFEPDIIELAGPEQGLDGALQVAEIGRLEQHDSLQNELGGLQVE